MPTAVSVENKEQQKRERRGMKIGGSNGCKTVRNAEYRMTESPGKDWVGRNKEVVYRLNGPHKWVFSFSNAVMRSKQRVVSRSPYVSRQYLSYHALQLRACALGMRETNFTGAVEALVEVQFTLPRYQAGCLNISCNAFLGLIEFWEGKR